MFSERIRARHKSWWSGTYVRIDFYASHRGCVFGEFAPTPARGRYFTPFADRYFEQIWRETFPEQIAA